MRRVESFLEQLFEGSIGRLFRSPIQPAEVAKKLERAMEENYVVAVDGVIVPNIYEVLLHPHDLTSFTAFRGSLVEEMEHWLREVAREERYRFVGPVSVRFIGEEGVPRRTIRVRAAIVDAQEAPAGPADDEVYTRDYRVVRTAAGSPACRIKVLNGAHAGHVFIIGGRVASIGRALDNDLVIQSTDVSRHHARLEQVPGGYRVVDLGSTNGTLVNGQRVSGDQPLTAGDTLTLGATELAFQMSDEPEEPGRGQPSREQRGGDHDSRRA